MNQEYFRDKFLVAAPHIRDKNYQQTVIYMCKHDRKGAMGLLINRRMPEIKFNSLLEQFKLEPSLDTTSIPIYTGGPVDSAHGFILHTREYQCQGTIACGTCKLSSSVNVLRDIANGTGPERFNVILGYAGWQAGQLEREIMENDWLIADANQELIFNSSIEGKWKHIMDTLGIGNNNFSNIVGHA